MHLLEAAAGTMMTTKRYVPKNWTPPLYRFLSLIKGFADRSKIKIWAVHWERLTESHPAVFIKCDFVKRPQSGWCLHSAAVQLQRLGWLWRVFVIKSSALSMFENQNHNRIQMQDVDLQIHSLQWFPTEHVWLRLCQKELPQSKRSSSIIESITFWLIVDLIYNCLADFGNKHFKECVMSWNKTTFSHSSSWFPHKLNTSTLFDQKPWAVPMWVWGKSVRDL